MLHKQYLGICDEFKKKKPDWPEFKVQEKFSVLKNCF